MSRGPHQSTLEGERLRRSTEDVRRGVVGQVQGERPIGMMVMFPNAVTDPGPGWLRANGQTLLRSRYPRLAAAFAGSGDDATIVVTAATAPVGFRYWVWGPEG